MKKTKILFTILALSSVLLFSQTVYASEITDEESTSNISVEDVVDEIDDAGDGIPATEGEILDENVVNETADGTEPVEGEEVVEDVDLTDVPVTTSLETPTPDKTDEEVKNEQSTTTYGWIDISTAVSNCVFEETLTLTFKFTNTETGEEIEQELLSNEGFESTLKLNYGTYDVELLETEYIEQVLFDTQLVVSERETVFDISVKGVTVEKQVADEDVEKPNAALELLKNNILFLVLLLGCGGYLLFKEIQRRRS